MPFALASRSDRSLASSCVVWVVLFGAAFSAPIMACMCRCKSSYPGADVARLEAKAAQLEQVFAGLVISTEQIKATPETDPALPRIAPAIDPGYWIRSKVLVLRIWRGSPPMVAEVWTRLEIDCDRRPFPGLYIDALTKHVAGRDVADFSECSCGLQAFATEGPASFAMGGIATIAAVLALGVAAFVWLSKIVRLRRPEPR